MESDQAEIEKAGMDNLLPEDEAIKKKRLDLLLLLLQYLLYVQLLL